MPRSCTICAHHERLAIDRALVDGKPFRYIATRWDVSTGALQRHKAEHLPAHLVRSKEAEELASADGLIAHLQELTEKARRIGSKAEDGGDYRTALSGVRELLRIVELQARLWGELDERPAVNVTVSSEWTELRAAIVIALEAYPEARAAVLGALQKAGGDGT
jgi:hypothetical protein